jgi:hypothetical protein
MEERELTRLLQCAGDRVAPGPAPVADIVREGRALRKQRHGRIVLVRVAAVAAAVVGGGSLAATVVDLPSLGGNDSGAESATADAGSAFGEGGGDAAEDTGSGAGAQREESATADEMAALATADPSTVAPGDRLVVRAADRETYQVLWRLERRSADGWEVEYELSAALPNGEPFWWEQGDDWEVPDVAGVVGPAELVIPPVAAAGEYRVCEAQAPSESLCAYLTVTE